MAPQRIFCHKFSFVSGRIGEDAYQKGGGARFHPTTKAIADRVKVQSESLPERDENRKHSILLRESMDTEQNDIGWK